jgi:hypothetical protein
MSLTHLIRSATFGLALAVTAPYVSSCGSECSKDSDCATELGRVCEDGECVDYGIEDGERKKATVYGVWKPTTVVHKGQLIDRKIIEEEVKSLFNILMFDHCNDGKDKWQVTEGVNSDGSCEYGNGGTFVFDENELHLQMGDKINTLYAALNGNNGLTLGYTESGGQQLGIIEPGDRCDYERTDYESVLPCRSPCVRFLGR